MKSKKTIIVALLIISTIGAAFAMIADLNGKWSGSLNGPDGNTTQVDYVLKADGSKLTGTATSAFGTGTIENGKITDKEITFNLSINGMDLPHKGTLFTDSIALAIDYNGTQMHVGLKRAAK
jgi:hypothetical protein